jgi:hypothetical protein
MTMRKWISLTAAATFWISPVLAQSPVGQTPLGFCSMSSMSAATPLTPANCALATFTGTGFTSGNGITASSVTGLISQGDVITGTGVPAKTTIAGQLTPLLAGEAIGGAGRYTTNNAVTSSAQTITAGPGATVTYAVFCAYTQGINYLDSGAAPTGTLGTGGQGIAAGNCIPYNATFNPANVQFIQQASGAIFGGSFYH